MRSSLLWWLPIWFSLFYVVASIRLLKPDEVAALYWLGKRWRIIGLGGIHFVPLGLVKAYIFSTRTKRTLVPGKKENIVRDDAQVLGPGEVRPVRIIHASMEGAVYHIERPNGKWEIVPYSKLTNEEKKVMAMEEDSLSSSITSEIIDHVEWNIGIEDGTPKEERQRLFLFVENVGDEDAANSRIAGTVTGTLQNLLGQVTARHAVEVKTRIESLIKEELEKLVGEIGGGVEPKEAEETKTERPWGINISANQIEEINPGRRLNEARAEQAVSISKRKETIQNAEAEAQAQRERANAAAYEETSMATARNTAFETQSKILETPGGRLAAQLEVAKVVLPAAKVVMVPNDIGGVLTSLVTLISPDKSAK